jgi:hypothetical protein
VSENPYNDTLVGENIFIRIFNLDDIDTEDLIWHRDKEDRHITLLEGENWSIQFDNELPRKINKDECIFVPKMVYHRVLIGTTNLKILVKEGPKCQI